MRIGTQWKRDLAFSWTLLIAFVVGFWLRIYLIRDQVFIDDEWHGFYYVIGKSPGWLLTEYHLNKSFESQTWFSVGESPRLNAFTKRMMSARV